MPNDNGNGAIVGDRSEAISLIAVLVAVTVGHLSLYPSVADLDGFYHIGHTMAYLEGSFWNPALPWATRSIVADLGGDLWWGFHVLLGPFAAIGDVATAMRLAGVTLTLALACTVYGVLRRHRIPLPGVWAALFLVVVPNVFFRYLMVRPHVLSMAAAIALLSVLVRGRWWQVLLLSAFMSWVHLNLFWMAPGLTLAYAVMRVPVTVAVGREQPDTGVPIRLAVPAAFAGSALGWILRPEPWATARLVNVQLVELFIAKASDAPVTFATELAPLTLGLIPRMTGLFLFVWLAAFGVVGYLAMKGRLGELGQSRLTFALTGLAVSVVFFALSLFSARRAMEQWVAFGFLAIPVLVTLSPRRPGRPVVGVIALLVIGQLTWGARRHALNLDRVAFPATTLAEASAFLEANSEPGDVVFHAHWDNFGPLLAHNRHNRYLGGMDPIFQLAHDSRAFWEFFFLSVDATTDYTCDAFPCQNGVATDTYDALADHFGARWVLVEPRRNPRLTLYLLQDPRFELALETQREAVFELLPRSDLP